MSVTTTLQLLDIRSLHLENACLPAFPLSLLCFRFWLDRSSHSASRIGLARHKEGKIVYSIREMHPLICEAATLFEPPEPHPLDYDWRFTRTTVQALCELIPRQGRLLILGAPSVARFLQTFNRDLLLVDRQPLQGVANHVARETATFDLPDHVFGGAIIDPPWYPDRWRLWTAWAARAIGLERDMIVSIWPSESRPNAQVEISALDAWLSEWAEVERISLSAGYEVPAFEKAAISVSRDKLLAVSPRVGRLLRIRVKRLPPLEPPMGQVGTWLRFVADDYQLALRIRSDLNDGPAIRALTNAEDWIWPFVSERAPQRDLIDLWSSRNEVATVRSPRDLAAAIRTALKTERRDEFEKALKDFPELMEWQIPNPPHRRTLEWRHQQ